MLKNFFVEGWGTNRIVEAEDGTEGRGGEEGGIGSIGEGCVIPFMGDQSFPVSSSLVGVGNSTPLRMGYSLKLSSSSAGGGRYPCCLGCTGCPI
jgi:hypothetical protein